VMALNEALVRDILRMLCRRFVPMTGEAQR
jgi:hypothetical protein